MNTADTHPLRTGSQRPNQGGTDAIVVQDGAIPLRRSLVAVRDLAMQVLDLFRGQIATRKGELLVSFGPELPAAWMMDGPKMAWALSLLIGNALRYVGAGSMPRVRLTVDHRQASDELELSVEDNGRGMDPTELRWLFDTHPETGRPNGLGLLMVRDVVSSHNGALAVQSHVGEGTNVTIRLPRQG
jgi:signal transduction histidine kinase